MSGGEYLITGAKGQLGRALSELYPDAVKTDSSQLDITDSNAIESFDWQDIKVILNAAAYTDVDAAESEEGQNTAWAVNDEGVGNLAKVARDKDLILVHISTDYVFDGNKVGAYTEDDSPSPLGVYAKSKAAGDKKAALAPRYYILRTSWVVGEGKNFVRTMLELGKKGINPTVVSDQIGRPSFTTELAHGIKFLLESQADFGLYNLTNEGRPVSWADFAREIFKKAGFEINVTDTTTEDYFAGKAVFAPRPLNSVLDLTKIEAAGFKPQDWQIDLDVYIKKELSY